MDARQARRRSGYKARDFGASSHARRLEALFARQRRDRAATLSALRAAAAEPRPATTAAPAAAKRRPPRPAPVALPEWLTAPPADLATAWFAAPRPDGKRAFVVASAGRTVVRGRDGRRMGGGTGKGAGGFAESALPGGRPGSRGLTVLDCIVEDVASVGRAGGGGVSRLWVLDVMVWNDRYMHDCSAEFRFFWLGSALAELDDNEVSAPSPERVDGGDRDEVLVDVEGGEVGADGKKRQWLNFQPVPVYDADEAGLSAATDESMSTVSGIRAQDGILLYAKDAQVELGLTPAVLAWKDSATSAHAIETFPEPAPTDIEPCDLPLVVTLSHAAVTGSMRNLVTSDSSPVVIAEVPEDALAALGGRQWQSRLVRVRVLNAKEVADGLAPEVELVELAGYTRTTADSWSRLLFQCQVRHKPVTLEILKNPPTAAADDTRMD